MKKSLIVIILAVIGAFIFLNPFGKKSNAEAKFQNYCGSCHVLPKLENIPKSIWEESVLPEMAARMGHLYNDYNPYDNSLEENYYTRLSNVYPEMPIISAKDWQLIHDYILSHAPDTVLNTPARQKRHSNLTQFEAKPLDIGHIRKFGGITNIHFDTLNSRLQVAGLSNAIFQFGQTDPITSRFKSPIVSTIQEDSFMYVTEIGIMNPSEMPRGGLHRYSNKLVKTLKQDLHRPVFTELIDLDEDGEQEIIICEFGHHTGELSMLRKTGNRYEKETLVPLPGSIKVEIMDMNKDGKKDIVALFAHGQEGVYILYQQDNLKFRLEQVITLGPEYGSSWFELLDYNADGHQDIVLVNGDNADYSVFLKPYHGIRLFLNDSNNRFEEKWFYPINGATRVIADDFDQDNDLDFAVLSFFPDFKGNAAEGFVYLENEDAANLKFKSYTTKLASQGNWLIMEKGDLDQDGDIDIFLGNFPILTNEKTVRNSEIAVLHLENKTIH